MNCPVCTLPLSISSREGVEIDFCPQCRGVWLDRGELDKIIDRVATSQAATSPSPAWDEGRDRGREERDDRDRHYDDRRSDDRARRFDPREDKRRRRRNFLEDLFDFD